MTHDEFSEKVLMSSLVASGEFHRIMTEGALLSPGLIAMIMEEIPDASDYLEKRAPEAWREYVSSRKRIAAAMIGRIGGLKKSAAKAAAARENGKKGGRPRKNKENKKIGEQKMSWGLKDALDYAPATMARLYRSAKAAQKRGDDYRLRDVADEAEAFRAREISRLYEKKNSARYCPVADENRKWATEYLAGTIKNMAEKEK